MKLYYTPGACSLAPHIVLEELGLPYESEKVDLRTQKLESGADFSSVNPKAAVPTLRLNNGEILTEAAVILQYLADQKPEAKLIPPTGSMERTRCQEWLNYISSELHKGLGILFGAPRLISNAEGLEQFKSAIIQSTGRKFDFLSQHLQNRNFVLGEQFTVTDPYLFTIFQWTKLIGPDLSKWPTLTSYIQRVASRPAVQKTLKAEGLIKD